MKFIKFTAGNEEETVCAGKKLAQLIGKGDVIALDGELGAGKTTFTRGLVEGLFNDASIRVKSPSFAIVNQYDGEFPVFHLDCYRLEGALAFEEIGIDEFLFSEGITVVEWAERMQEFLPEHTCRIKIDYEEDGRCFYLSSGDNDFMKRAAEVFNA